MISSGELTFCGITSLTKGNSSGICSTMIASSPKNICGSMNSSRKHQ